MDQHRLIDGLYDEMLDHHGLVIRADGIARKHLGWALDQAAATTAAPPEVLKIIADAFSRPMSRLMRARYLAEAFDAFCRRAAAVTRAQAVAAIVNTPADAILHALPHPVIMVSADGKIADANVAAEQFFEASTAMLRRHLLRELVPFGSPLLTLIEQVRRRGQRSTNTRSIWQRHAIPASAWSTSTSRRCLNTPSTSSSCFRSGRSPTKMDRQLTHRGAARSVIALAAMLAHEIKNPLVGHSRRGAAA